MGGKKLISNKKGSCISCLCVKYEVSKHFILLKNKTLNTNRLKQRASNVWPRHFACASLIYNEIKTVHINLLFYLGHYEVQVSVSQWLQTLRFYFNTTPVQLCEQYLPYFCNFFLTIQSSFDANFVIILPKFVSTFTLNLISKLVITNRRSATQFGVLPEQ